MSYLQILSSQNLITRTSYKFLCQLTATYKLFLTAFQHLQILSSQHLITKISYKFLCQLTVTYKLFLTAFQQMVSKLFKNQLPLKFHSYKSNMSILQIISFQNLITRTSYKFLCQRTVTYRLFLTASEHMVSRPFSCQLPLNFH